MKEYIITGMTCAACSARVEKAACAVNGVEKPSVSLLTNSMTVEGNFDEKELERSIKNAGYGISPKNKKETLVVKEEKRESIWKKLVFSFVLLFILMYFSMGHMLSLPLPGFFTPLRQGAIQMLLSLWILILHKGFFQRGIRALFHRSPNMDTLVSIGSGASFLYSLVILFLMIGKEGAKQMEYLHGLYFESAAMILVLITVGKLLEEKSKGKTTDAIRSLQKLAPSVAFVKKGDLFVEIPMEEIKPGDLVRCLPGERIPVDGTISSGESAVDESSFTGESIPVDKKEKDFVYTGTMNLSGKIVILTEKAGGDTALSHIIERVTAASASKAPIARLADKVSGVFVPVVMTISLVTFVLWLSFGAEIGKALSFAIAVLVVSCPCALGLATPVSIMVANGVAAKKGVLFKTSTALEEAGKTNIVVLDKTGTITSGKMKVSDVVSFSDLTEEEILSIAHALEEGSLHPIACAIKESAEEKMISGLKGEKLSTLAGFGVEGLLDGEKAFLGKAELFEKTVPVPEEAKDKAADLANQGKTVVFVSYKGSFCGLIAVSDTIKEDSERAVSEMKKMGLRVIMVTGDRKETAENIAKKVGIEEIFAQVLPEGKEEVIAGLKKDGKVMMVGDGINDAPALTRAHQGVAIGTGMDIAMDAAEIVLMKGSTSDVPRLILLSQKTLKNIKENLFWAFCYNLIGIPLAAGVFFPAFGLKLSPMFGALAMSFSSFFVVSNSLRLNLFPWEKEKNTKVNLEEKTMTKILKVEGMMCPHCEAHVKKALEAVDGVVEVTASHEKNEVQVVLSKEVETSIFKEIIEKEGYKFL
ncbi:MAG: heavy metal translocating P-type ATPase [Clostridia bacterium]|nr:heavy metal translocating P-type ATPase [Clostridia bacterium]